MNIETAIIEKRKLLKKENTLNWIYRLSERDDEQFKELIRTCVDDLYLFIDAKIITFEELHKILHIHRESLTDTEYLTLIKIAEEVIQDYLELAVLESKARIRKLDTDFMASKGYVSGNVYAISYPDAPRISEERWLVTEFRVNHEFSIRPWHGHKIRKDGQPAVREIFISLADFEPSIKLIENKQ